MKLSEFKKYLSGLTEITFLKPDGSSVPKHFHITEVGQLDKRSIDCGGKVRHESIISMQLWESVDVWHRLDPIKLKSIIESSEKILNIGDHEIAVEYQSDTIGKFGIKFETGLFKLTNTNTACLAEDQCGIPTIAVAIKEKVQSCCTAGGGCC